MPANPRFMNRRSDIYIMRAYHLIEDHSVVKMKHLEADVQGGFILYGRRDDGKGKPKAQWPLVCAASAGRPDSSLRPGVDITYTIDTGMGHRCKGYGFVVLGYAIYDAAGVRQEVAGNIPAPDEKINAYVFK